jgi:PKHD-type hydroxylase|tara:strand:- start:244 stop:804 length:561 start_codon:yes stop_codon:yes gene_type:complete
LRLRNNAWTFEGVLSKDMCDEIIAQGLAAKIVKGDTANKNINKKRDSQIAWLYDPNIMQMLERYIQIANREAGWNFQWDSVKAIQFTQYKSGQHYGWHRDTAIPARKDGKIRKLSLTVNLNNDYVGGEMYIDTESNYGKKDPQQLKKLQKTGSISVFPADTWHKVAKVTEGTRYSLVVWLIGDEWR